jgi:rod shape determining protein RodA
MYFFVLKPYQQARIDTTWYLLTNQMDKVDTRGDGWVPNYVQTAVASAGLRARGRCPPRCPTAHHPPHVLPGR